MQLDSSKISWIKNKNLQKILEEFLGNIIDKKGQDIIGILIFGSLVRAQEVFDEQYQSDIDILIIANNLPKNIIERKLYTAKLSKSLGCGIDQLWYTPEELLNSIKSHRAFFMEIIKYGKIIFEINQFLTNLKEEIEKILKEKGIKEGKNIWIWPQKKPGCKIEW
ncbi:MAG: nucleotidyltransferase domain-containing protein [Candidatus Helarchaeota archaeon]